MRVIGLLYGGRSGEHEVSVQSAASIWQAIDRNRYNVIPLAISKLGRWTRGLSPLEVLSGGGTVPETSGSDNPMTVLSDIDIVFPVLHGPFGEDGTIQGLLETLGKPYVGAGVLASAIGMDKAMMKTVFAYHGFPQTPWLVFSRQYCRQQPASVLRSVEQNLGFPCFVKPANMGSSVGISKVRIPEELPAALSLAAQFDRKIVVEAFVDAREIECSVLGNEEPQASVPGEIVPAAEFYDYQAKYVSESKLLIPAPIAPKLVAEVQQLAIAAFKAIDCSGLARVDFFLRKSDGRLIINEINTMPGFTRISMYPKLWEASGLSYPRLLNELITLAVERQNEMA